jgi:hypothetical protein
MTEPSGRTNTVFTRLGSGNGVGGAAVAEPPAPIALVPPPPPLFEAVAETGVIGAMERVGEASAITAGAGAAGAALLEDAAATEEFVDAGADAAIDPAEGAATMTKGAAAIVGGL